MTVIIQEETTGCGIASVANIVEQSYAAVKNKANSMGIFADNEALYSDTQYVRTLLAEYGLHAAKGETPFVSWVNLPDLALLAIKYQVENNRAYWHWVVFKRVHGTGLVLDSATSMHGVARSDFQAMKPRWFVAVTK